MGDFDWEIWARKAGTKLLTVIAFTGCTELANIMASTEFPVEHVWWTGIAVTILLSLANMIKHKWLT